MDRTIELAIRYFGDRYYRGRYANPRHRWYAAHRFARYYASQGFTGDRPD